jgi:hypothetical protein
MVQVKTKFIKRCLNIQVDDLYEYGEHNKESCYENVTFKFSETADFTIDEKLLKECNIHGVFITTHDELICMVAVTDWKETIGREIP